ncbi:kinesin-related protein 12-like [Armigeres subalbatus]|uniref:kinesin-related protein 12-like n=1 Tax=Armigeres subalbatus TaxID=124917 RepID=UPI002ED070C7
MSNKAAIDRHCTLCEQSDNPESMIECARCHTRYHNSCAGNQDGTSATSSPYYCEMCVPRNPAPSVSISSSASTSASAREAKLQLQMQKLAEEKMLQERIIAEREKTEKERQEKALRLEKERSDKAIADRLELEKVYVTRKYDLLLAQVDEEEEERSVRSRRSSRKSADKVQAWIDNQPATLNSKSGENSPTGITSQQSGPSNYRPMTAAQNLHEPQNQAIDIANIISAPRDLSIDTMNQLPSGMMDVVSPCPSFNPEPTTSATVYCPSLQSTPFVASHAAGMRQGQPDDVDADQKEDHHNRTYPVQIDHSISKGNATEAEQSLFVRSGSAPVSTPTRRVRMATDTKEGSATSTSAIPFHTGVSAAVHPGVTDRTVYSSPFIGNCYNTGTSSAAVINSRVEAPRQQELLPPAIGSASVNPSRINVSLGIPPGAVSVAPSNLLQGCNYPPHQQEEQSGQDHCVSLPSFEAQHLNSPTVQQLAARHVVSKELPAFTGNPAEWPLFWSSYETSTRICGYSDSENLMRLQRCLKGEARKAVTC